MEWFNELIGFLIILLVFLVPLIRKVMLARKQKRPSLEIEEEQEEEYEVEYEEEVATYTSKPPASTPYVTKRLVKKDLEFHTDLESRELESVIEARHLESKVAPKFKERIVSQAFILAPTEEKKKGARTIVSITRRYTTLQTMVVLSEILGRPKGSEE